MDVRGVLDGLFPSACSGCGAPGPPLCRRCLPPAIGTRRQTLSTIEVWSVGPYSGALRAAILAYKRGRRDAGDVLAGLLATRLGPQVPPGRLIVPVPTAPARRRERGFDQGVRLAELAGARLGLPVLVALRHATGDAQRGRSRAARLAARKRFACTAPHLVAGARIVLVDDVVTTGATLRDCAAVLQESGASVREALVLAYA